MYIKFTKWHILPLQSVRITISILIFIVISNNISVQFVEIKCADDNHTLQTVNIEFGEKIRLCLGSYVYNVNTTRTTWKHCHVYSVNRGCPRGHMTHWSKKAL